MSSTVNFLVLCRHGRTLQVSLTEQKKNGVNLRLEIDGN